MNRQFHDLGYCVEAYSFEGGTELDIISILVNGARGHYTLVATVPTEVAFRGSGLTETRPGIVAYVEDNPEHPEYNGQPGPRFVQFKDPNTGVPFYKNIETI